MQSALYLAHKIGDNPVKGDLKWHGLNLIKKTPTLIPAGLQTHT